MIQKQGDIALTKELSLTKIIDVENVKTSQKGQLFLSSLIQKFENMKTKEGSFGGSVLHFIITEDKECINLDNPYPQSCNEWRPVKKIDNESV